MLSSGRSSPFAPQRPWLAEAGRMLRLAFPIALSNLALMAIGATDVLMMGWLGPGPLAAGSLAANLIFPLHYFALGVVSATAAIMAQALGARAFRQVRRTVRQGFWVACAISAPAMVALWQGEAILLALGQQPDSAVLAQGYLRVALWGFLPALWFVVLRGFVVCHQRPRSALVVTVAAIVLNAACNYGLMFGHFGLPRLELVGAAISTVIVDTAMFAALLVYVLKDRKFRRYYILARFWRSDWPLFREILRLGVPIGLTVLAEAGMFAAAVFLMGLIGTIQVAANAIALQVAGLLFMIPLGIANAATVRVGYAVGAGDAAAMRRAGWTAVVIGLLFGVFGGIAIWFADRAIVSLFLDPELARDALAFATATGFLRLYALFLLADCTQGVAAGALRGLKDTRTPMIIATIGYWVVGVGASAVLAFALGHGGTGIWYGLGIGLSFAALFLLLRFWRLSRRGLTTLTTIAEVTT